MSVRLETFSRSEVTMLLSLAVLSASLIWCVSPSVPVGNSSTVIEDTQGDALSPRPLSSFKSRAIASPPPRSVR